VRLDEAFRAGEDDPPSDAAACPSVERIWDAVHGDLASTPMRDVIQHLRVCGPCAAEWRAAMDPEVRGAEAALIAPWRRWAPLAAAAVLVVGVGLVVVLDHVDHVPGVESMRATVGRGIQSLIGDDAVLPRERFLLRWAAVEEDARYTVKVDLRDLTPVTVARDLHQPEFLVSAEALKNVPSGATLVWRVEATLVDGSRVASKAFLARLE